MKILGNSVLGYNFGRYGLALKEDGLYKTVKIDGQASQYIFLTNDPEKILEIIEVDFEDVDFKEGEEVFPILVSS